MRPSLEHIPRREIIAIVIVTAAVMTAALALLLKFGFVPLLIA